MPFAPCPHRPPCPGCPRYGEEGVAPGARARLGAFAAAAGVVEPVFEGAPGPGARHRARLMVRGRTRTPKIGLFQEGSHKIVDVPQCVVHHPTINRVAAAVRRCAAVAGVSSYADSPHRGALRAVQITVSAKTGGAQLVLIENATDPAEVADLASPLREELGDTLDGLWWNGNPERTNAILGPHWHHLFGERVLWERLADRDVAFPPAAFAQSQPFVADAIARRVRDSVPAGARVLELFAGTGALGLALLDRAASVTFVESNPAGSEGLALALAQRPEDVARRAHAVTGAAEHHLDLLADADAVVLDPPRKGLHRDLLDALAVAPAEDVVWVSCGLDAFLEQAKVLLERSGRALAGLWAYPLFPFSEHVETVAHFRR